MSRNPERIVDGGGDEVGDAAELMELRSLLQQARSDLPPAERLSVLFAKLPPVADAAGDVVGGPTIGATAAKGAISTVGKWLLAAGVLSGALGAVLVISRPARVAVESPPSMTTGQVGQSMVPFASAKLPASAAPLAPNTSPSVANPVRSKAVSSTPLEANVARPEVEILKEAQAALGSNPARALTLASEHERDHPQGALTQEREMVRILALHGLGREAQARLRAAAFRERYPKSAHLNRLNQLLGLPSGDQPQRRE